MKKIIITITLSLFSSVIFAQTQKYSYINQSEPRIKTIDSVTHSATITIGTHPIDGLPADFSKDIIVLLPDGMSISQSDAKCSKAIVDYLTLINK